MKNKLLKTLLALLLAVSLLALASCAGLEDVIEQVEQELENTSNNNDNNNNSNNNNGTNNNTDPAAEEVEEVDAFKVTFVTDEHSSVTVYPTQDMTTGGTENATKAYSIDKTTNEPTKSGDGQVNFVVVLAEGYVLDDVVIDNADGYKNLKGSADTGVEYGFRITKITADLTVTVTTRAANASENYEDAYKVTFVAGHATVTVYKTQDMTRYAEENATEAYSRKDVTGKLTKTDGQVNFLVVPDEGYEIDSITAIDGTYNAIKGEADTGVTNGFRITKITADTTVTITAKAIGEANEEEAEIIPFKATFVIDEHVSVTVGNETDVTVTDVLDKDTSQPTNVVEAGQINFVVVLEEGYEIDSVTATAGTYKNIKGPSETGIPNGYRITKINGDLTVTITTKVAE